ncbi:unnamed protein product, partial [Didymodactylos carnosus]
NRLALGSMTVATKPINRSLSLVTAGRSSISNGGTSAVPDYPNIRRKGSTTTTIIVKTDEDLWTVKDEQVTGVKWRVLPVRRAIPIIMGANIGTSVTNTLVALTHSKKRDEFRRAFAGATVHDMFNWATVLILLPLEVFTGLLYHLTRVLTQSIGKHQNAGSNQEFLSVITKPITERIIQIDKHVIQDIAIGTADPSTSLIKRYCQINQTLSSIQEMNITNVALKHCNFIFAKSKLPDWSIGLILLILSILSLCVCLVLLVKVLQSMLQGAIANIIRKTMNAELPGPLRHLTGYLAMLIGCILTIFVQSSSIFTSTLTPLVGLGIITVERVYPFTLGSNIGTTITGIMAALTAHSPIELQNSLQIALCHTFFNILGIVLWYPIPVLRMVPIRLAKKLGETTAVYRWFAVIYILLTFFILPLIIFGLSMIGWYVLAAVLIPIVLMIIFALIMNTLMKKMPERLPDKLKTWSWVPRPIRSLGWYDEMIFKRINFKKWFGKKSTKTEEINDAFQSDTESTITNISRVKVITTQF